LKKKIQSAWQGFYVVVLPEYGVRGIAPPTEYIDQLMKYLGKNYYVALLSAAEIYGAAHQAPQEFFVICNTTNIRSKIKKDVKINFVAKKIISQKHLTQIMTNSGYINVSSPILTVYDLVCYIKSVGGINRVATIINDLTGKIRFTNVDKEFIQSFSPAVTQRLGYLFEELGFTELANKLYRKTELAGLKFRKTPLVIADKTKDLLNYPVNDRWKLIINEQIDIDE
jgi:predicted transcriptional regulator of viral defense system